MNTSNISCKSSSSDPCHYTIEINVPANEINSVFGEVEETFKQYAKLPGFRQGKIPNNLIKRKFADKIGDEVKQQVIRASLETAIEQCEQEPVTMPSFVGDGVGDIKENSDFSFTVEFDVAPKVNLPDYKTIKLDLVDTEATDEDVDKAIDHILRERGTYNKVDSAAKDNDMLKVSYATADFEEADVPESAKKLLFTEETWVVLIEPEIIPGILEGLTGASADEEVEILAAFPDDFHESFLAGKSVSYKFKIHEVHARETPELTDDFVKSMGGESVEEFRSLIKEKTTLNKMMVGQSGLQEQVNDYLLNETESFSFPQKILEQEKYYALITKLNEHAQHNPGQTDDYFKDNKEELEKKIQEEAENRLKLNYIVQEIAKQEELAVTQDEVDSYFNSVKGEYEQHARKQNRKFEAEELKLKIKSNMLSSKVFDKLIEYGSKKDN